MMILSIPVRKDFDFAKIMRFQPFFFFFTDKPTRSFIHDNKEYHAEFYQDSGYLCVRFDEDLTGKEKDHFTGRITYCLGLDEDYTEFYTIIKNDPVLKKHYENIYGNRLLSAYTEFEAAVGVICSQNVTFRLYKQMVKKIVDTYGEGRYFPTPEMILEHPELLKDCGVGYRDKYIIDACHTYRFKETIPETDLTKIKGFGRYSYDIFRLFQERDYSYFYVDRLITKIFQRDYAADLKNDHEVRSYSEKRFGRWSGLAEVYLQKFLCDNR